MRMQKELCENIRMGLEPAEIARRALKDNLFAAKTKRASSKSFCFYRTVEHRVGHSNVYQLRRRCLRPVTGDHGESKIPGSVVPITPRTCRTGHSPGVVEVLLKDENSRVGAIKILPS
jgi:hypothetical protein